MRASGRNMKRTNEACRPRRASTDGGLKAPARPARTERLTAGSTDCGHGSPARSAPPHQPHPNGTSHAAPAAGPITVAYADPPFPRQARKHYKCPEVDHRKLIDYLVETFPDGWALSTSSPALRELLPLCPPEVRVAAWTKTYSIFHVNVNPQYCWEPVLFCGGRRGDRRRPSVRDWMACPITLRKGLVGAKPEPFCKWLFELLGLVAGDTFVDLFPGTGGVTRAWEEFLARPEEVKRWMDRIP